MPKNPFSSWTIQQVEAFNTKTVTGRLSSELAKERTYENHREPSSAIPKPPILNGTLATKGGETKNPTRIIVRVKSYRKKLLDFDNLTVKYFVDGLRYAGLIPDDTPDKITLEVSQEKSAEERTEIEII